MTIGGVRRMFTGVENVLSRINAIEHKLRSLSTGNFDAVFRSVASALRASGPVSASFISAAGLSEAEKVGRVQAYMRGRGFNPALAAEAESFVRAAQLYGMDWRLAPALAMAESSGGRYCFRPYNPFGIMGRSFSNFREAIYEVNRLVRSYGYGNDLRAILTKYNPAGGEDYIRRVLREMESI